LWATDANEESWTRNTFGTLEPDPSRALTSSQALPTCTAIVVPSQAINPHGFRLGQGKGFYDRALAEVAGLEHPPLIIGVTFESEFLPEVPKEEHDIPVNVSVTESTVRWFNTPD
jgi:5-formyltetrahydrofolate cyclo-ligase